MSPELLNHMVSIMNKRKTWIKASIEKAVVPSVLDDPALTSEWSRESILLTVVRSDTAYRRRKKWRFPIYEVSQAVTTLSQKDNHFFQRAKRLRMTSSDIEKMILLVSAGVIHLNLFKEDYD